MTRRRWIADQVSGDTAALTGSHAEHLCRVLRARVGQEFDIAVGDHVRRGKITRVDDTRVEFTLGESVPMVAPPSITLALSIFKFDRMDGAIEKCTELGVSRIIPVIASRTEKHLAASSVKRMERWQRLAHQAAEQSRRISAPEISQPVKLKDAIDLPVATRILLSESEPERSLKDALNGQPVDDIILAVGPEGGWTEEEFEWFDKAAWMSASLGHTILRAETAAIAATAIVLAEISS
jgi:16S rRNA (uracil1498-N3)-methyltransferase